MHNLCDVLNLWLLQDLSLSLNGSIASLSVFSQSLDISILSPSIFSSSLSSSTNLTPASGTGILPSSSATMSTSGFSSPALPATRFLNVSLLPSVDLAAIHHGICPGFPLDWPSDIGDFDSCFPVSRLGPHTSRDDHRLPLKLVIDWDQNRHIYSLHCRRHWLNGIYHCPECSSVPPLLKTIYAACRSTDKLQVTSMNPAQLAQALKESRDEADKIKLEVD